MNKERYSSFAWFEELEQAARKEQRSINGHLWTTPAPKRPAKHVGIVAQLVKFFKGE